MKRTPKGNAENTDRHFVHKNKTRKLSGQLKG